MQDELREYELGFVTQRGEDEAEVARLLEARGASIVAKKEGTRVKLAYPIRKEHFGYFGRMRFKIVPDQVASLRDGFQMRPEMLRFVIVAAPAPRAEEEISHGARDVQEERVPPAEAEPISSTPRPLRRQAYDDRQSGNRAELSNEALEKKLEEILRDPS